MLIADDPTPYCVQNEGAAGRFIIICDHAGQAIPRELGDLGLPTGEIDRHIGWDIGAAALSELLAERLDACAILQPYSRLVIDCNRDPARPDAMLEVSDGTVIPANAHLGEADRMVRVQAVHAPYHARIEGLLDARAGAACALLLIHSFTPVMAGMARPWRLGVLHRGEPFPLAALTALRGRPELPVGDNQPYAMDEVDYTAGRHGAGRGLPYVEIEVRQDLLQTSDDRTRIATVLEKAILHAAREVLTETAAP